MNFIDVINRYGENERIYTDRDVFVSKDKFTWEDKNDILLEVIKEMNKRNKERGVKRTNKPTKGNRRVITSMSASTYKNGKRVPIFNQKEASDLTIFNDGTYDYNKVRSQDYNDKYFKFDELKEIL